MIKQKTKIKFLSLLSIVAVVFLGLFIYLNFFVISTDVFQSWESKNLHGEAIYNQIYFLQNDKQDIWFMKQAQNGIHNSWDYISIIVDTTTKPFVAKYYQLLPMQKSDSQSKYSLINNMQNEDDQFENFIKSPDKIKDLLNHYRVIQPKINCLICHTNGPRKIRPDPSVHLTNLRAILLNFKMMFYPRIKINKIILPEGLPMSVKEVLIY